MAQQTFNAVESLTAVLVEDFRKALQRVHSNEWTMEVVAEAAHICAREIAPKVDAWMCDRDRLLAELTMIAYSDDIEDPVAYAAEVVEEYS